MNYTKKKLDYEATGLKIWQTIQSSKFTIEMLAELLGVEPRTVYYWTSGQKLPKLEMIANLTVLFGIKAEDILVLSS